MALNPFILIIPPGYEVTSRARRTHGQWVACIQSGFLKYLFMEAEEAYQPFRGGPLPVLHLSSRIERAEDGYHSDITEIPDTVFHFLICLTETNDEIREDMPSAKERN